MKLKKLIPTFLSLTSLQAHCQVNISTFECDLYEVDGILERESSLTTTTDNEHRSQISCINENDGSAYFFRNISPDELENLLRKGQTRLQIVLSGDENEIVAGCILDKANIKRISPPSSRSRSRSRKRERRRKLYKREGTRMILTIRVTSNDDLSPTYDSTVISDKIFGTFGNTNNLRSGYNTCSGGKLDMAPAQGLNINDGVMELKISQNITNVKWKIVQNYVRGALIGHNISITDYDNVLMILPPQVDFEGAAAWAFLSFNVAIFKDTNIRYHLVLMHELGHNLGYHHSGNAASIYGDDTCFMGGRVWGSSQLCFNAAKSWYSGWYSDRHMTIEPMKNGGWSGYLVGIDDYLANKSAGGDYQAVIKIRGTNETDLFAMMNGANDVNDGVSGSKDQLTIVSQNGEHTPSIFLGTLNSGDIYRVPNWSDSGNDLAIQDCSYVDIQDADLGLDRARVRIFMDDGNLTNLQCNQTLIQSCNERIDDRFFLKLDIHGNIISRKCKWLLSRNLSRQKQLCRQIGDEPSGQKYRLPRYTCCNTCGSIYNLESKKL